MTIDTKCNDVRFGSKADICSAKRHVRFPPNSDRESGLRQPVMSALLPKADMCSAIWDVRFGPKADIPKRSTPLSEGSIRSAGAGYRGVADRADRSRVL